LGGPYTEHRRIERVHFVGAIEPDIDNVVFDREADAIFRTLYPFT
jgi:hypothetical protein